MVARVGLSKPVLSDYLRELTQEQIVTQEIQDRRVVYVLTQRGKAVELLGTRLVSTGLRAAGSIVPDPKSAELLGDMARMAKENSEMFRIIMDWALNLGLLMTSDPVFESRWLQVLAGNKEAWYPFEEEIKRRASAAQPKTLEEFRAALDDIQSGIKQVLEAEKTRKGRK